MTTTHEVLTRTPSKQLICHLKVQPYLLNLNMNAPPFLNSNSRTHHSSRLNHCLIFSKSSNMTRINNAYHSPSSLNLNYAPFQLTTTIERIYSSNSFTFWKLLESLHINSSLLNLLILEVPTTHSQILYPNPSKVVSRHITISQLIPYS